MKRTAAAPAKHASRPIPVRLDEALQRRLKRMADKLEIPQAAVMRLSVACTLHSYENGTLLLPVPSDIQPANN